MITGVPAILLLLCLTLFATGQEKAVVQAGATQDSKEAEATISKVGMKATLSE